MHMLAGIEYIGMGLEGKMGSGLPSEKSTTGDVTPITPGQAEFANEWAWRFNDAPTSPVDKYAFELTERSLNLGALGGVPGGPLLAESRGTVAAVAADAEAVGAEGIGTRRAATKGDTQFRNSGDALAEALRRHGVDPSTVETTPMYGKNPNLTGPQGQPWEVVRGLDSQGEIVKFEHHANGHFFNDTNTFELPHYHGPDGEHLTY